MVRVGVPFVPPVILVIPDFLIVGRLKWLGTLVTVIVPTAAGAFGVFLLRQFFLSLPEPEKALLDGAVGEHHPLRPADGRTRDRQRPRPDPLRVRRALRHRG